MYFVSCCSVAGPAAIVRLMCVYLGKVAGVILSNFQKLSDHALSLNSQAPLFWLVVKAVKICWIKNAAVSFEDSTDEVTVTSPCSAALWLAGDRAARGRTLEGPHSWHPERNRPNRLLPPLHSGGHQSTLRYNYKLGCPSWLIFGASQPVVTIYFHFRDFITAINPSNNSVCVPNSITCWQIYNVVVSLSSIQLLPM